MIIDELFEGPQLCPECGGISFSDLILAEKKDACYYKVKASAKVWPSAYASGRLVQCRKKGAANYGKSKTESVAEGAGNIGNQIKALYQKIYDQGDDAVEFMYYDSPIFAQYWDEYEGNLDSIIAEVDPSELQIIYDELLSAAEDQGVAEGSKMARVDKSAKAPKPKNQQEYDAVEQYRKDLAQSYKSKKQQGVAEGSDGAVSFREMIDVVDQHYPKYYAELSGSDISDKQFERAIVNAYKEIIKKQGMAEQQELDEKWSQKYKSSINCANPKGFSQRAHCAGRKKNEDVAETRRGQVPMTLNPGETDNLEPEDFAEFKKLPEYQQGYQAQQKTGKQPIQKSPYTFQSDQDWAYRQGATDAQRAAMFANFGGTKPLTTEAGDESQKLKFTVPIIPNNMPGGANLPAGGAPKWTSTKIPGVSSHTGPAPKVTQSPNINTKIDAAANVPAYIRRGLPDPVTTPVNKPKITVRPGETQSQAMQRSQTEKEFGKFLQGQSGQTFGPGAGRGNTNPAAPNWKNDQTDIDLEEASKQQKGADYRDPKEVDYDDEYDAMVARVKRLAGLGPMKTVYDPAKRQYRNMPTAVQPKK